MEELLWILTSAFGIYLGVAKLELTIIFGIRSEFSFWQVDIVQILVSSEWTLQVCIKIIKSY